MKDAILKLKIMCQLVGGAFNDWHQMVWKHDLDELYCCNGGNHSGDICGCGGITLRDVYLPVESND